MCCGRIRSRTHLSVTNARRCYSFVLSPETSLRTIEYTSTPNNGLTPLTNRTICYRPVYHPAINWTMTTYLFDLSEMSTFSVDVGMMIMVLPVCSHKISTGLTYFAHRLCYGSITISTCTLTFSSCSMPHFELVHKMTWSPQKLFTGRRDCVLKIDSISTTTQIQTAHAG